MGALLTKEQVAELAGRSTSWVEKQKDLLQPAEGPIGRNGKPTPLYDLAALPADVQKLWAKSQRQKVVEIAPAAGVADAGQLALTLTAPVGPNLSVEDQKEANWRFTVIEPLVHYDEYKVQYPRKGELVAYLSKAHDTKMRTIYRWLSLWQTGGLPALVRRDRSDKGQARSMNDAAKALLLKLATPQKGVYGVLRIAEMWRVYEEERVWRDAHITRPMAEMERQKYALYLDEKDRLMPAAALPKVSYETFRVWFNRIPEMVRTLAREGGEAYRNSQEIISHRDFDAVSPLDWVVMDHRRLDIFCLMRERGGWKLARPWLTAAIDMRTRKWLAWSIVETPSSDSIATCLKRVFLNFGLPKELYWDNGKDFRCEWFEGKRRRERTEERIKELDPAWRGVLGTLGIRVRHAIVRNARAKLIEPNFGRVSNIDRGLPEWCGHKPGARPERMAEMVKAHDAWADGQREDTPFRTIDEIAALYNAAMRNLNEMPLEGEGMRKVTPHGHGWMCPNEAWELLIGGVERRSVPADVLHMCFAKRKELTVKHGEIVTQHLGRDYHYRLADNSLRLMKYNGQAVEFAYDPFDLGEGAVYYESRFLGLVTCVELRRMGEQAFVEDEKERRRARREIKKAIQAVSGIAPAPSLEERLARREELRPARVEVVRVEVAAELPAPVVEAAAAVAADREFAFEAAETAVVSATETAAPSEDEEFTFFGD
jgi:transposase InsO family protein